MGPAAFQRVRPDESRIHQAAGARLPSHPYRRARSAKSRVNRQHRAGRKASKKAVPIPNKALSSVCPIVPHVLTAPTPAGSSTSLRCVAAASRWLRCARVSQ